ncbi:MAG: DUF192 domain-containing protein [Chloroflexota bacterium]
MSAILSFFLMGMSSAAGGGTWITRALPSDAHVIQTVSVRDHSGLAAVTYSTSSQYLAIVSRSTDRTIWSKRLGGIPAELSSPEGGTVAARVPAAHGYRMVAVRVADNAVSSAIAGHRSGQIFGDEGAWLTRSGLVTHERDWQHKGSVRYRIVQSYRWNGRAYTAARRIEVPDYPNHQYPSPNAVLHPSNGDTVLLRLEVADTEAERETGLMNRASLDADSGMVFVWQQLSEDAFWMQNTEIPLSVAFLSQSGKILAIDEMQPETTTLHFSPQPYWSAIEVNEGYFEQHGIVVKDTIKLDLDGKLDLREKLA